MQERPGRRFRTGLARYFDQYGAGLCECSAQRRFQQRGRLHQITGCGEAFGQLHEVRIGERGADLPALVDSALVAQYVAIARILNTMVTRLMLYLTAVANSCTPNMNPPSPVTETTSLPGLAIFTPSAVMKLKPTLP
jgi:hypothetical protein